MIIARIALGKKQIAILGGRVLAKKMDLLGINFNHPSPESSIPA